MGLPSETAGRRGFIGEDIIGKKSSGNIENDLPVNRLEGGGCPNSQFVSSEA
jgi:hypothetical protein